MSSAKAVPTYLCIFWCIAAAEYQQLYPKMEGEYDTGCYSAVDLDIRVNEEATLTNAILNIRLLRRYREHFWFFKSSERELDFIDACRAFRSSTYPKKVFHYAECCLNTGVGSVLAYDGNHLAANAILRRLISRLDVIIRLFLRGDWNRERQRVNNDAPDPYVMVMPERYRLPIQAGEEHFCMALEDMELAVLLYQLTAVPHNRRLGDVNECLDMIFRAGSTEADGIKSLDHYIVDSDAAEPLMKDKALVGEWGAYLGTFLLTEPSQKLEEERLEYYFVEWVLHHDSLDSAIVFKERINTAFRIGRRLIIRLAQINELLSGKSLPKDVNTLAATLEKDPDMRIMPACYIGKPQKAYADLMRASKFFEEAASARDKTLFSVSDKRGRRRS